MPNYKVHFVFSIFIYEFVNCSLGIKNPKIKNGFEYHITQNTLMSLIIGLFIIRVLCVATFENINVLVYNKCLGLVCLGNITK